MVWNAAAGGVDVADGGGQVKEQEGGVAESEGGDARLWLGKWRFRGTGRGYTVSRYGLRHMMSL